MRSLVAYRMLLHDRASTAGSVLGVVAILFLVGQQLSTLFGLFTYMSVLVDHSDADVWICGKFTDNANSTGLLPVRYVDRINGLREIEWAEPVITTAGETRGKDGKSEGRDGGGVAGAAVYRGTVGLRARVGRNLVGLRRHYGR